jgi:putative ABC transport system ATP-binding protein
MLEVKHVSHNYGNETILHDINFMIQTNAFTVITGESGSGKSTLLSIISTLLKPSKGEIFFDGESIQDISNINHFRNLEVGFIFQFHYLIAHLSVYENIAMVTKQPRTDVEELLAKLDISELSNKYPDQISGGQRQRVAIARAMINRPKYIFADEPTGNLDSRNSKMVFDLLRDLDATVIVATHDLSQILPDDQVISLKDGQLC